MKNCSLFYSGNEVTMTRYQRHKMDLDFHLSDFNKMTSSGYFDFPIVRPVVLNDSLLTHLSFSERNSFDVTHRTWIHTYISDYSFESVWRTPEKYIELFMNAGAVTPADFSTLIGMPEIAKMYNVYRNRFLERYYQDQGVVVVPNVSWSGEKSFDYCLIGLPKNSIIAINCTGIIGNPESVRLWENGYHRVVKALEPKLIIRYGDRIDGEYQEISQYFENNNLKRLRNGR